jgi:hypothetical protein
MTRSAIPVRSPRRSLDYGPTAPTVPGLVPLDRQHGTGGPIMRTGLSWRPAMMLSLALAILLAATLGADAAPQAEPAESEAWKIAQVVTVSGECTKLVHAGVSVGGCEPLR